jgi:hypothetical protein
METNDSYFNCNWVIENIGNGVLLEKASKVLDHFNSEIRVHGVQLEHGYWIGKLTIRIPQTETLDIILKEIGLYIQLTNFISASSVDFVGNKIIPMREDTIYATNMFGERNRIQRLKKVTLFRCKWIVQPVSVSDLVSVFDMLDRWDYVLHYRKQILINSEGVKTIEFIVQVLSLGTMEEFLSKLPHYLKLAEWVYENMLSPDQLLSSEIMPFDKQHAADFIEFSQNS